jgi:hypothetical protein
VSALLAVVMVMVLIGVALGFWLRSAHGLVGRATGEIGLHRARRSLDTAFLKQDIRRDGRRLRREMRHKFEDLGES